MVTEEQAVQQPPEAQTASARALRGNGNARKATYPRGVTARSAAAAGAAGAIKFPPNTKAIRTTDAFMALRITPPAGAPKASCGGFRQEL